MAAPKTRILVTHQVHFLATEGACDAVIFLKDGAVEAQGTYAELLESSESFRQFLFTAAKEEEEAAVAAAKGEEAEEPARSSSIVSEVGEVAAAAAARARTSSGQHTAAVSAFERDDGSTSNVDGGSGGGGGELVEAEGRTYGMIDGRVWLHYFQQMSLPLPRCCGGARVDGLAIFALPVTVFSDEASWHFEIHRLSFVGSDKVPPMQTVVILCS